MITILEFETRYTSRSSILSKIEFEISDQLPFDQINFQKLLTGKDVPRYTFYESTFQ